MSTNSIDFSTLPEEDLLDLAKKNNQDALSVIHDRFYPQLWRYVCFRLSDIQHCEDIVSEVFFRLIKILKTKQGSINSLNGWLFGTTRHVVMDHWRKKYRHPEAGLSEAYHISDQEDTEKNVDVDLQLSEIKTALQDLPEDYQNVIVLRFINGLSLEETAKIMKKSVGAVKVLQFRAINRLRKTMGQLGWLKK